MYNYLVFNYLVFNSYFSLACARETEHTSFVLPKEAKTPRKESQYRSWYCFNYNIDIKNRML